MERNDSTVEVQEDDQEIIKHKKNKQRQSEDQGVQEVLVEKWHESEQEQETYRISSSTEDDEILVRKAEMESCKEEEQKLLMRAMKEIRCDPERIPPNLRDIDRKKVRVATVKVNKIVSLIKTETITERNSVLRAAGNIVADMVGYENKEMTGNRHKLNWQKRILEKFTKIQKWRMLACYL